MVLALVSCNKNDDNSASTVDPIFSQPYTPLASLNDLELTSYRYAGNKIGDRPVGLVEDSGVRCKENDLVTVYMNNNNKAMFYYNHFYDVKTNNCVIKDDYPRSVSIIEMGSLGLINVNIGATKISPGYKGDLEIGFQAGYLRIEDHMSDYHYTPAKEKAYLYFKKM